MDAGAICSVQHNADAASLSILPADLSLLEQLGTEARASCVITPTPPAAMHDDDVSLVGRLQEIPLAGFLGSVIYDLSLLETGSSTVPRSPTSRATDAATAMPCVDIQVAVSRAADAAAVMPCDDIQVVALDTLVPGVATVMPCDACQLPQVSDSIEPAPVPSAPVEKLQNEDPVPTREERVLEADALAMNPTPADVHVATSPSTSIEDFISSISTEIETPILQTRPQIKGVPRT